MAQVGIVTDSSASLSRETLDEYNIRMVPMSFVLNNKIYRDNIEIDAKKFWEIFPGMKDIPTTGAGSLGDFRNAYLDLSHNTDKIVCITMIGKMSATYKAACQAAEIVREEKPDLDIKVIDSKTNIGSLAWLAVEAARAAKAGMNQTGIIDLVQNMIPRVKYFMVLESLKYILKVARAPDDKALQAAAQVSSIMGMVTPGVENLENLGRAANVDQAMVMAVDMVKNYVSGNKPLHFMLHYPQYIEKSEEMGKALANKYNCAEFIFSQFTPTVMVATGPMYGLAFYG